MDFYEEMDYLINILKNADSDKNNNDALERLEKILEEYVKKHHRGSTDEEK